MYRRRSVQTTLLVLMVLSAAVSVGTRFANQEYTFPGPLPGPKAIVIPRGTPEQVALVLKDAGAIREVWAFRIAALATRGVGPIHAGEFTFPQGASLRDVLAILRTAKPVEHHVTIREGLAAAQIALLVDGAEAMTGDTPVPREGHVLPDTYAYEFGTPRTALLARATAAMDRTLARIWSGRAADLPLATEEDLLTVASIVERETSKPEERPMVAAVFLNRLRLGMKLQADPTVAYAVSGGAGTLDRPITRADLS
ncbi:MAG TPA: endolytic transglycosylase MltG, partial [Acetobacteraceae bacterium]|nr:endolytic transglycosylase MltG [Acetobacteraceae bacterium]